MCFNIEFAGTYTICSCCGMLVCLAHVHMLQVCCLHGLMQGRGLQEVQLVGSNASLMQACCVQIYLLQEMHLVCCLQQGLMSLLGHCFMCAGLLHVWLAHAVCNKS